MRLTENNVKTATTQPGSVDNLYKVEGVQGLFLRVQKTANGTYSRSFVLRYRPGTEGPQKRHVIGSPTNMTFADAKRRALEAWERIREGEHPAEPIKPSEPTLAEVTIRFLQYHASRKKSGDRMGKALETYILPALGRKKMRDLSHTDVQWLHATVTSQGKPVTANRVLALLSSLWSYHEKSRPKEPGEPRRENPCRFVERHREQKRERYLTTAELERLGTALTAAEPSGRHGAHHRPDGKEHPSAIAAIRLLLLTGARKSEILTLRWSDVDLERGLLRLPDSKTGKKDVLLGAAAVALLADLPRREGNPYVCWGDRPDGHLIGMHSAWDRIRKTAGLEEVRIHDLRHTFASIGVGAGYGLPVVGRLLGHTTWQTTDRYAHLEDSPVRIAANAISDAIGSKLLIGRKTAA
ncbi:MAG TPA: site-specific integrase [Thermoanaerobaculia bacterium]|jgi:integrase|nr:site-specific integrase [Thermoanaerobaculia bacterium]